MDLKINSSIEKKTYEDYINAFDQDEKSKVKEIFDLFDKNLDGHIDLKELKFIMNSLDIYPNHDELTAMLEEADIDKDGKINETDFLYIISKQKMDHKQKLTKEASGSLDLTGGISTKRINQILKGEFELSDDLEKTLKKVCQNKDEISFEDFIKFFQ